MTDNEMIKALECCGILEHPCDNFCPMFFNGMSSVSACTRELHIEALNIINRQKAEIERLTVELAAMRGAANSLKEHYHNAKAKAIKEFVKKSEKILIEHYKKYHDIANRPKKETDMFYQGRAETIWECIVINRYILEEMVGKLDG